MLSRPITIDRSKCVVGLPSSDLEGGCLSPILHISLQRNLITTLFERFGDSKITTPVSALERLQVMENWILSFPPHLRLEEANTGNDELFPWVPLQRHYMHVVAYAGLVDLAKPFLAQPPQPPEPLPKLQIKHAGVDASLQLMECLKDFFNRVYPDDLRHHSLLFAMFDTATLLFSALVHDTHCHLPRRNDMREAVSLALSMLHKMASTTESAMAAHNILACLLSEHSMLPNSDMEHIHKKAKIQTEETAATYTTAGVNQSKISANDWGNYRSIYNSEKTITEDETAWSEDFAEFFDMQLHQLGMPWDWESLDLGLLPVTVMPEN